MMCRNVSYKFLVRHNNAPCGVGSVFTSDVREASQRALSHGCPQYEVVNRLETVTNKFKGMPAIDTSVPIERGAPMALGGTVFLGAMAASPGVVNRLETVTNKFKGLPSIDTYVPFGRGAPMALGGTAFMGVMAASAGVVNRHETVTNGFKGMPAIDTSVPVGGGHL